MKALPFSKKIISRSIFSIIGLSLIFFLFQNATRYVEQGKAQPAFKNGTVSFGKFNANGHALSWDGHFVIQANHKNLTNPVDSSGQPFVGGGSWYIRAMRPSELYVKTDGTMNSEGLSQGYFFAISKRTNDNLKQEFKDSSLLSKSSVININSQLNALAITPKTPNSHTPYASDRLGNAVRNGAYRTYDIRIMTQQYGADSGDGEDRLGFLEAKVVIKNPYTNIAEVEYTKITKQWEALRDINGNGLLGIEPTATLDGRLLVYNENKTAQTLRFSFNNTINATNGSWSPATGINQLYNIRNGPVITLSGQVVKFGDLYRIANNPLRVGDGSLISRTSVRGAYPWINLDGDDLFFTTQVNRHHPNPDVRSLRAGLAVVGASTKGLIRHIDGGLNNDRYGGLRLTMSSFDKSPGKWTPKDLKHLPLSTKPNTMPMFQSNTSKYYEVSFYESLAQYFDFYFEMNESFGATNSNEAKVKHFTLMTYKLDRVQDTSGYFHEAVNHGGVFSDEYIGRGSTDIDLTSNYCQLNCDTKEDRYSGKAMYFSAGKHLSVPVTSFNNHKILDNAKQFTVVFAIKPLNGSTTAQSIVRLGQNFQIYLTPSNTITYRVNNKLQNTAHNVVRLSSNKWSHVAISFDNDKKIVKSYLNGDLVHIQNSTESFLGIPASETTVHIGPLGSTSGNNIYALDQVGLAHRVLSPHQISFELYGDLLKQTEIRTPLSEGLLISQMKNGEMPGSDLFKLGERLFFDTRLSSDGRVSCGSCHDPSKYFTDGRSVAMGVHGRAGERNTPTITNMSFNSSFFYDGRASSLSDVIKEVMGNSKELNIDLELVKRYIGTDEKYKALFIKARKPASLNGALEAMSAYMADHRIADSKNDQAEIDPNIFNEQEILGRELFHGRARCAECHNGSNFSDNAYHNLGFVPTNDKAIGDVTGVTSDNFMIKTPSLRNIASTAPYFHNGSVGSLSEVVDLYNTPTNLHIGTEVSPVIKPLGLNNNEKQALVAYLNTLTSSVKGRRPTYAPNEFSFKPAIVFNRNGLRLAAGEMKVFGKNNEYKFVLQHDGNLVLYRLTKALWHTQTHGNSCQAINNCFVIFQTDGNLVLYRNNKPLWHTQTSGRGVKLNILPTVPFVQILNSTQGRVYPK